MLHGKNTGLVLKIIKFSQNQVDTEILDLSNKKRLPEFKISGDDECLVLGDAIDEIFLIFRMTATGRKQSLIMLV